MLRLGVALLQSVRVGWHILCLLSTVSCNDVGDADGGFVSLRFEVFLGG